VDSDIQFVSEVNDVDRGNAPYSGAPYAAIEALTQQSQSAGMIFNELRRQWCEARMRKRLALCRQYYTAERHLFLSDRQRDEEAESVGMVANLSEFFSCGVQVHATLATPELPMQRIMRFLEMATAGMFAPEQLPVTLALIKAMNIEGVDVLTEDLIDALSIVSMQAQQKAEQEAQNAEGMQSQAEQEARETAIAVSELDTQNKIALEAAKILFPLYPDAAMNYLLQQGMEEEQARAELGMMNQGEEAQDMPLDNSYQPGFLPNPGMEEYPPMQPGIDA
jgi:hypothetical protein